MLQSRYSRRDALINLLATGCAACLSRLVYSDEAKLSQVQAEYQGQPKGSQACANCMHFRPPSSCNVVDGTISPNAWCKLWAQRSKE